MVLNLTLHEATPEQVADGVVDMAPSFRAELCSLLTFTTLPSRQDVETTAHVIVSLVREYEFTTAEPVSKVLIGGEPFLMPALQQALEGAELFPLYSFSTYKHVGFV